jgi:hypothetical protein
MTVRPFCCNRTVLEYKFFRYSAQILKEDSHLNPDYYIYALPPVANYQVAFTLKNIAYKTGTTPSVRIVPTPSPNAIAFDMP